MFLKSFHEFKANGGLFTKMLFGRSTMGTGLLNVIDSGASIENSLPISRIATSKWGDIVLNGSTIYV